MDRGSSNSPDPPSDGLVFVPGEDTQLSTTLQNALQPLPDTKPDSQDFQRISPENCSAAASPSFVQQPMQVCNTTVAPHTLCIQRPQHPSDPDFSVGFTFGKPNKLTNGQFSDHKFTKPMDSGGEPALNNNLRLLPIRNHNDHAAVSYGSSAVSSQPVTANTILSYEGEPLQNRPPDKTIQRTTLHSQNPAPRDENSHTAVAQGFPVVRAPEAMPDHAASPEEKHSRHNHLHQPRPSAQKATSPVQLTIPQDYPMQNRPRPKTAQDTTGQPVQHAIIRKKQHPFDDYQPTYRTPNPQKNSSTPVTALENSRVSAVEARSVHPVDSGKYGLVQQNHQRESVSPSSAQAPKQKPRTSLQNDISVSSAQPPRQMPTLCSTNMVNRPMKNTHHRQTSRANTPARVPRSGGSITRSSIVRSNSKAKRSPFSQAPTSCRSSSSTGHRQLLDRETPSTQQHWRASPQGLLNKQFATKFSAAAAEISGVLNSNLTPLVEEVNKHLGMIYNLKHQLKQQKGQVCSYKKQVQGKNDELEQLEEKRGHLLAEVEAKDQELRKTSAKVSKLDDKCHQYKQYLNSAITEQQELYKASKAKCDGALAQMKAEDEKRKVSQERERKKAEETREKLHQLVQSTVADFRQKERDFHDKIEALNQRVQEREADVLRERETTQALLQKNDSIFNVQDTLKTIETQIKDMTGKVDQVVAGQHFQDDERMKDIDTKLDQAMQYLRVLDKRTLSSTGTMEEMQEITARTESSIIEQLEPILTAQIEAKDSLNALKSEIARSVDDLWEALEDRQSVIEEYCEQQLAEREQRIKILQGHVQDIEGELAHQNQLFYNSEKTLRAREATIDALTLDMEGLTQAQHQNTAQLEHLEQLRKECAELKDNSIVQGSLVSELQTKLQASTANLSMEEHKHQEQVEELRKILEQQVAEAKTSQAQAVEAAQQEAMLKINVIKADIDAQLQNALQERAAMQLEVNAAKQKITLIENEGAKTSEKAASLGEQLQSSRAESAKAGEQATFKDAEHQVAMEQQQKFVEDLTAQVEKGEAKFSNLAENVRSYDRAAQAVVLSLKQWTKNYATIQTKAEELRKGSRKNGVLENFDVRFKPLVELQLLHTAVSQYCESQKDAAQMLSGRTEFQTRSQMLPTFEMAAEIVRARIPRVSIKSPASNAPSPVPPSVQIEQERRRLGEQPRSILKMTTNAPQSRDEEMRGEFPSDSTALSRSPYNRPVAGSSGGHDLARDNSETRKRSLSFGQESERKRMREPEKDKKVGLSPPPEQVPRSGYEHVPHAPRKAGKSRYLNVSKGAVNDELQMPPARSSQAFQDEPRVGSNLCKLHEQSLQSNGQDPLSLFLQRRRRSARAKQEPLHSQGVGDHEH